MRHRERFAKTRDCAFERVEGSVYHLRLARDPGGRALRFELFGPQAGSIPRHRECRLRAIVDTSLRAPIENYFRDLQATLAKALRAAQAAGELAGHLDAEQLALMLMAVIQGGFVLSRIYRDRNAVRRATDMAAKMLAMLA